MHPLFVLCLLLLFNSCSSRVSRCETQVTNYRHGEHAEADDEDFPIVHYTQNREATRLLLDRALIRLQQGDAKGSLTDFCMAIDAIDYYRRILLQETAMQLVIDDEQSPYIAKDYEGLLARLYAAFACYQLEQPDDAFVFLKQAMTQEDLRNELENRKDNSPLLAYLMGVHLERQRDFSQAAMFYQRAYCSSHLEFIQKDLQRVASQEVASGATVLLIVHNGLIPEKTSLIAPASIASAAAVEILISAFNIPPAISSLSGIAIPAFSEEIPYTTLRQFSWNGQFISAEKIEDIFTLAERELKEEIPGIAAQAVARQLIRRAAVGVVREKNPLAGDIVDLFAFAANLATKADTRMWRTLPQEIYLLRMDLPAGLYRIGYGKQTQAISLKGGELRVLQFFHPSSKHEHWLVANKLGESKT